MNNVDSVRSLLRIFSASATRHTVASFFAYTLAAAMANRHSTTALLAWMRRR